MPRERGRNGQLIRQWGILLRLERSRVGVTVRELAAEHGVHWRTVTRDLEALQVAGFPLFDTDGRWRVELLAIERLAAGRVPTAPGVPAVGLGL